MPVNGSESSAPRPYSRPLVWALVISLSLHLIGFFVFPRLYAELVRLGLLRKPRIVELQPAQKQQTLTAMPLPLEFVEVDPLAAVKEPPKDAKYYSSRNAKAANPDLDLEKPTPKIDGKQTKIVRVEDVNKPKAVPLQPKAPEPSPPEPKAEAKPKETAERNAPKIGELAMARPADRPDEHAVLTPATEPTPPAHVRPRTLAEAAAQNKTLIGQKMKQSGGANRSHIAPTFDTRQTSFGDYDGEFIRVVQDHWYSLIQAQSWSDMRAGRVELEFDLDYQGHIHDLKVLASDVDDLMMYLCQRAILDPDPFQPWPRAMRQEIGSNFRHIKFTFYYE